MLEKITRELGEVWYILIAIVTLAWYLSQASNDISSLKTNDEKQDVKIEAFNADLTTIKVDTSYIRARMDGLIPPQKYK